MTIPPMWRLIWVTLPGRVIFSTLPTYRVVVVSVVAVAPVPRLTASVRLNRARSGP